MKNLWKLLNKDVLPLIDSTVFIKGESPQLKSKLMWNAGKGIIIGKYILTVGHLFFEPLSLIPDPVQYAKLHYPISCQISKNGKEWWSASLVFGDGIVDIALLTFSEKFLRFSSTIKINQGEVKVGKSLYYVGHQENSYQKVIKKGQISSGGSIDQLRVVLKKGKTIPGESGSPVFSSENNELLGILAKEDGTFWDIKEIAHFIKDNMGIDLVGKL